MPSAHQHSTPQPPTRPLPAATRACPSPRRPPARAAHRLPTPHLPPHCVAPRRERRQATTTMAGKSHANDATNKAAGTVGAAGTGVTNAATGLMSGAASILGTAGNAVTGAASGLVKTTGSVAAGAGGTLKSGGQAVVGGAKSATSKVTGSRR